ncbi:MAG TPA: hypothetical protein VGO25_15040 [Rhodanobacteraceae bacterium]|jgi:hypothetical protein|nr:hypothetical protein [Rhodanobacteraceae bacterium]
MKALIRVTLALVATAACCPAFATDPVKLPAEAATAHASAVSVIQGRMAKHAMERSAALAEPKNGHVIDSTVSGPRLPNASRAYPPSCLADPLPTTPTNPIVNPFQMALYTRDNLGNPLTAETVTITLWRLPCSSSGALQPYNTDGGPNAALLMRIDRDPSVDGNTTQFPTFPLLSSTQGSNTNDVRAAMEPNTVVSDGPFDSPVYVSTTYVLENYPYPGTGYTFFDFAHNLIIDPVIGDIGTSAVTAPIGDYTTVSTQNLPIDGYMSSAYYDTAHSGEGLVVEIYDNGDGATRTIFASWYTYDTVGLPFWLVAQASIPIGTNNITNVPVYYFTGGGFAGNFGASSTTNNWGTMSFNWPSCNAMSFTFNGATDPSVGGPSGSGTRNWTRLSDINGLNCE